MHSFWFFPLFPGGKWSKSFHGEEFEVYRVTCPGCVFHQCFPTSESIFIVLISDFPTSGYIFIEIYNLTLQIRLYNVLFCLQNLIFYRLNTKENLEMDKTSLISSKILIFPKFCLISGYVFGMDHDLHHITTGSFSNFSRRACWSASYLVSPPGCNCIT